jgi:hypothetical protein
MLCVVVSSWPKELDNEDIIMLTEYHGDAVAHIKQERSEMLSRWRGTLQRHQQTPTIDGKGRVNTTPSSRAARKRLCIREIHRRPAVVERIDRSASSGNETAQLQRFFFCPERFVLSESLQGTEALLGITRGRARRNVFGHAFENV